MKSRRIGDRHPLLIYRRSMSRIWKLSLILGIMLMVIWGYVSFEEKSVLSFSIDLWLIAGAAVAFALSLFAFLARYMAYVQANKAYLSVVTPFLRLKISYRRLQSAHPVLMQQLFPKEELRWRQRNAVEPFYGKTALVVELRGYPANPILLRMFLPSAMFSPRETGFVFLVPDWMKFSTELDSLQGAWLQLQGSRVKQSSPITGSKRDKKKMWG